ncbi:hypothetical protein A3A48_02875 [Candidatus Curtissbacteria bacterium RIFCSPLOWO2_01_FULL_37_9]|uniref:histidine kinase n=1 Tax=Candidatus Curtissbacteria bacterium RIFCSPLOWO2_01_FULL_37_9 TaxID=1797724 RepID=A0A1F5GTR1_9BACT|nr:MAG: hypothetical protein A3A48_02875 [Candidatus Curtissbacteria bacterium RIFCSPLOWO2_01_FULL_37_9]
MSLFQRKLFITTPKTKETIKSLWKLEKIILDSLDFHTVVQKICDSVLTELGYLNLGYRIIVLTLVDEKRGVLRRISLSQTTEAANAQAASEIPFHEIEIPLNATGNLLIKTLQEKKPQVTHYWPEIFTPILTEEQSIKNQSAAGIKTSMLYPVIVKDRSIGVLIFSMIKDMKEVSENEEDLIKGYTDVVGLAVQNSLLYSTLEKTTRDLAKANERLKELDKLKDDFVSVASHELRTPMTAIKSYLWMALNKLSLQSSSPPAGLKLSLQSSSSPAGLKKQDQLSPEDLKRYLSRSYISVERLINLVNDMLNISRIEGRRIALKLEGTDLYQLTSDVVEEVIIKAKEKDIKVNIINKPYSRVLCDKDKIHEVLLNLIGNSLKFTKNGGQISVGFVEKPPYVLTSVSDNGIGIAPENINNLFTKFGRLESSYVAVAESGGTGLGLYICKSLIELHKGTISAKSSGLGKGTTFSFTLPSVGTEIAQKLKTDAPKETEKTKDLEKTKININ